MTKQQYTALIHLKGWKVKDFLEHYGRGLSWWDRNTIGNDKAQLRLEALIDFLPEKGNEHET